MRRLHTDVAVIGGGLIGCWTALFLRRRGLRVVLLEKGDIGAQSSGVNFGNLRLQGRFLGQLPLALRAAEQWDRIEALLGERCEYDPTGHLYVAFDDVQVAKLDGYAGEARRYGLDLEMLDRAETMRRFPWLGAGLVGASWSARDATANPRLVTPAAARAALSLGAEIAAGVRVTSVTKQGDRFLLETDDDLAVQSEHLVNAAGAWGGVIARMFGETAPIFAGGPPQFVTEPVPYFIHPAVQAVDGRIIFRQIPRGNVIVAGYPRGAADMIRNKAPVDAVKTLVNMQRLLAVVPGLAGACVIRVWSGIEGYLPDMLPVIGPSRTTPGLIHAFGFCGHGFQLGPGVGLVISELIADGMSDTPLEPFGIERFEGEVEPDEKFLREFDARNPPLESLT